MFVIPDSLPTVDDSKDDEFIEEFLAIVAEPLAEEEKGVVQLSPDESKRFEALNQAVEARQIGETPSDTVERAKEFYEFLIGDES